MKKGRFVILGLALLCLLAGAGLAVLSGCGEDAITNPVSENPELRNRSYDIDDIDDIDGIRVNGTETPELRNRPYDIDGIRVNGTEVYPETGEPQRTFYFVDKFGNAVHNGPSPKGNYWTRADSKAAAILWNSMVDKH